MRRLALLVAMALALAACASGEDTASEPPSVDRGGAVGEEDFATGGDGGEVDVDVDVTDGRQVIRRARLQLHAADTRAAFDEIMQLTESVGGFVASADVYASDGEDRQPDVSMVVRVPADQLASVLNDIKETVDEVVSESQEAQDVTEQFVDLEARLTNLEALEIELRALLEEVRQQPDADPSALLEVFNELANVRGQIEQLQGQINYLSDLTALATVEIFISQTPETAPIVDEGWEPLEQAKDSLRNLVSSLQDIGDWVINFALFTLPVLAIILVIPAGIGFYAYRRWRAGRMSVEASDEASTEA